MRTVLNAIDRAGIAADTIVIYSSDQGYTLGEHGMTEKHYAYEQVMRIPLIMRYPRLIRPGTCRDEMVLNIDVAPTLYDLCGGRIPEDVAGRSWRALFEAEDKPPADWREQFFFEYCDERAAVPAQIVVRTRDDKLIRHQYVDAQELYDLRKDQQENRNVAADSEYAGVLRDTKHCLNQLIQETALGETHESTGNLVLCAGTGAGEKQGCHMSRDLLRSVQRA